MTGGPAAPERRGPGAALALIVAIVAIGAAARLYGLGDLPLWYDECASILRAQGRWNETSAHYLPDRVVSNIGAFTAPPRPIARVIDDPADIHPPLYFLCLRGFQTALGRGPGASRLLSALASIAALAMAAALAFSLGGPRAGVATAALAAAAPFEVAYAQEARPYALLGLVATIATLALARLSDPAPDTAPSPRGRVGWWAVYVAALVAGLWASYFGIFVPAAHFFWYLGARRPAALRRIWVAWAVAALALSPQLLLLSRQIGVGAKSSELSRTHSPSMIEGRAHVPRAAVGLAAGLTAGSRTSLPLAAAIAAGTLALIVLGARRADFRRALPIVVAATSPLALLSIDLVAALHGSERVRYATPSSLSIWVAAGLGIAALSARSRAGAALAALALAAGLAGAMARAHGEAKSVDFRAAARALEAAGCDERDLVVTVLPWTDQIFELEVELTTHPYEFLVFQKFDFQALERPWRHVFVLVEQSQEKGGTKLAAEIASRTGKSPGVLEVSGLRLYRFAPKS